MREAPAKVELHEAFARQGLQALWVDLGEDRERVRRFAERYDLPAPVLLDQDGSSPRLFGLWAHPNTVLIDRQGRVLGLVRGERDWHTEEVRRLVRQLLDAR